MHRQETRSKRASNQERTRNGLSLWAERLGLRGGSQTSRMPRQGRGGGRMVDAQEIRIRANVAVTVAGLVLLTPFGLNNFLQGRMALAFGSLAVIAFLGFNAWLILERRPMEWVMPFFVAPAINLFLVLCFLQQGVIAALWSFPAVISYHFTMPPVRARIASATTLAVQVPVAWVVLTPTVAVRFAVTMSMVIFFSSVFVYVVISQQRRMRELMVTDPLTGVSNRMILDRSLELAVQRSRRIGAPATLIALDLDQFKLINDTFGHGAGDDVLCAVGRELKGRLRCSDQAFRTGGEEFLVVLEGCCTGDGRRLAEDLRAAVEKLEVIRAHRVTASFGVAGLWPDEDWQSWMRRADRLLYRSKEEGRNRVTAEVMRGHPRSTTRAAAAV